MLDQNVNLVNPSDDQSDRVARKRSNRANHDEMLLAEALKRFWLEIWIEASQQVHMLR